MLKRIVTLIMIASLCTGIAVPIFAADLNQLSNSEEMLSVHQENIKSITGDYSSNITIKKIYDLNENEFELIETGNKGYYIFDNISKKYIEQSPNSPSPYINYTDNLYYFGPMNYYIKNRNVYEHTVLSNIDSLTEEVAQEIQNTFDAKLSLLRKEAEKNVWILNNQTDINAIYASEDDNTVNSKAVEYYIPNYTYIRDAIYPKNENETCGYTAACILLNYWHKKKGNVIASTFLDAKGNLKTSGYTLQDQLLSYGKTTSTDGEKISNVINKYCEEYGVNATARYYWLNWDAFAEVNSGRPVIVFGLFPLEPEPASLGNTKHAVTAYGTRRSGSGGYLIVHYGWSGYEHVLLDPTLMGSSTQFVLN